MVCLVHPASGLITTAANADTLGRVEDAINWLSPLEQFPDDPPSEDCLLVMLLFRSMWVFPALHHLGSRKGLTIITATDPQKALRR